LKIYFLVNESQGDVPAGSFDFVDTIEVDLIGPPAPTGLSVSVNDDDSLLVSYTESTGTTDVKGYQAYCHVLAGAGGGAADWHQPTAGTGGVGGLGGAGGVGGGVAGSAGAVTGGGGSGGAGGTTSSGTGGTTSSGAGGSTSSGTGGSGDSSCYSDILVPGSLPEGASTCGSRVDSGDITVDGLTMGQEYVIAVAAIDNVDNVGPLSTLGCGTPEEVLDFFDAYRDAGGQAGGGLCQCQLVGLSLERPLAVAAVLVLGLAFGLRRSRRQRGRS